MKNRICKRCKEDKPLEKFHITKGCRGGRRPVCDKCIRKQQKANYDKNSEKVKAKQREYNKEHPEVTRKINLKKKYGTTMTDYDRMWNDQNGLCAGCGRPETAVRNGVVKLLSVDHNHKTGKIRALLCQRCNYALGFVNDSVTRLMNLIEYLERHD